MRLGTVRITQILFGQGFGSRRICAGLVQLGEVQVAGRVVDDPDAEFEPEGLPLRVQGMDWVCHVKALLMLHKPAGYECSQKPRHHLSVMSLLPAPLRTRGVQPVGRLDEDTTGLLLFTDDGALIHRLTHPRSHVAKVYEVATVHPVDEAQCQALVRGVLLNDDPDPASAEACAMVGPQKLRMTLTEGRYHQVKRMVAAAGNRVERLHRSQVGPWTLPADLAPGQWAWLDAAFP